MVRNLHRLQQMVSDKLNRRTKCGTVELHLLVTGTMAFNAGGQTYILYYPGDWVDLNDDELSSLVAKAMTQMIKEGWR